MIKLLRMLFIWPLIFIAIWYFFSFQIAAIFGLVYLHVVSILLINITEKQKDTLVEIVEYIKRKDGLIDPQTIEDLSTIQTADDVINAILSLEKTTRIKK